MRRRVLLAIALGLLTTLVAWHLGSLGDSLFQALMVGGISSCGYVLASVFIEGRLWRRQRKVPELEEGEVALLYGPGSLADASGKAEGWLYLSNRRLRFRSAEGEGMDLRLDEIETLRPAEWGLLKGRLSLSARQKGQLYFEVPDANRWYGVLSQAVSGPSGAAR